MNIYFDNASTTPLLDEVKEKMKSVIDEVYGNPSSIHRQGRQAKIIVENARKIVAECIGASTGEIFFTSGATEANNMALLCSIRDLGVKHVISATTEHHCITHTLDYIKSNSLAKVTLLPVDTSGHIDYNQLSAILEQSREKCLISLMHVNNEIGTMHDVNRIAEIAQENQALFNLDSSQSMGKYPIDVNDTNISFLCGSAHKFHGPKGVGFIYIKNENMIQTLMHGGDQERGLRSGTENIYGIAGMAEALQISVRDQEENRQHIKGLKDKFLQLVQSELEDIKINGSDTHGAYNIISLSFPKTEKSDLLMMNLDIAGICASAGSACSSGVENASHVLEAIGHDPERKAVRFSFSKFNTLEEIEQTIESLKKITPAKSIA